MDKRKSVKGPNVARDKPMSTDSSTQAQTRRVAKLRRRPFVARSLGASSPRKVDGPRRKICGMLQLAFHKLQHTSPGLACSPAKAKSRCWAPQAGSMVKEEQQAKTPLHKVDRQTRHAGSLSHCQNGRLDAQAASPTAKMADSLASQFHHRLPGALLPLSFPSFSFGACPFTKPTNSSPSQSTGRRLLRRGKRRRRTSRSTTTVRTINSLLHLPTHM